MSGGSSRHGAIRMPFPTTRIGDAWRSATAIALSLVALLVPIGCESFFQEHRPEPIARSTQATEPPPVLPATSLPGKHATRRGCYVFYHDFELDNDDPMFAPLEALPDQVYGELKLPPANTVIQVFLFDTQERYERFMFTPKTGRYRHLPSRRAYFIAEPRIGGGADELKVFTWMGDHLKTDLRHELTHALLNGVLKGVPLWLDEGLAGFFELPPSNDGVNIQHLDCLRRGPFQPDLIATGEVRPGSADGEAGVPRVVGVGPLHASRRRGRAIGVARIPPSTPRELESRPACFRASRKCYRIPSRHSPRISRRLSSRSHEHDDTQVTKRLFPFARARP